jgi:hypothetical protein
LCDQRATTEPRAAAAKHNKQRVVLLEDIPAAALLD